MITSAIHASDSHPTSRAGRDTDYANVHVLRARVREASFDLIGIRGKEATARTRLGPFDAEDNDYYGQNRAASGMRAAVKFPRAERQIDGWIDRRRGRGRGREREREREEGGDCAI